MARAPFSVIVALVTLLTVSGAASALPHGAAHTQLRGVTGNAGARTSGAANPPPPAWANQFMFVASVQIPAASAHGEGGASGGDAPSAVAMGSTQFCYDWSIPAAAQVVVNNAGEEYTILNVRNKTWRVNVGNSTCCLCNNPYSCGDSTPPTPDWLQRGNSTKYLGVTTINERACNGWAKYTDVAVFGWWTSVATGVPCQLAWMLGQRSNMVMSYYTDNAADVPADAFTVPAYCPMHPNAASATCSISGFG